MHLDKVITTTRRLESRIKAASIRIANKSDYAKRLESLGLSRYAREFETVYEAAGTRAAEEALKEDWDVADVGGKIREEGSFISGILPSGGSLQEEAEVTVGFTVQMPEWMDLYSNVTLDISEMMERVAGRDRKSVSELLRDRKCGDYILSSVMEALDSHARKMKLPTQILTEYAEVGKVEEAVVSYSEKGYDTSDSLPHWDISYTAGGLTSAPRPVINAKGEVSVGLVCRLIASIRTDKEVADVRHNPAWFRNRQRGTDYDDY